MIVPQVLAFTKSLRDLFIGLCLYITLLQFRGAIRAAGCFDGNGAEAMRAFLGGGCCGRGSLFGRICGFDDEEDHKGDDQEVDNVLNEIAICDHGRAHSET